MIVPNIVYSDRQWLTKFNVEVEIRNKPISNPCRPTEGSQTAAMDSRAGGNDCTQHRIFRSEVADQIQRGGRNPEQTHLKSLPAHGGISNRGDGFAGGWQ